MFCCDTWTMLKELPGWAIRSCCDRRTITFLRHREALGDTIMVTGLARELKRVDENIRIAIASRRPEIFANNPNIDENRGWHLWRSGYTVQAGYHRNDLGGDLHAVEIQWNSLWKELKEAGYNTPENSPPKIEQVHPEIHLTEAELEAGRELGKRAGDPERPLVLISSGGKLKPTHNREWGQANYQTVVEALAPHVRLMQIGGEEPLTVDGKKLHDVGMLPIRETAALFAACDAMLVQEGGLMHVARAVDAPTVVIFGGYVLPQQTGYRGQVNLWAKPECSPCILTPENCPHLKCMVEINPRLVLRCIVELIRQRRECTLPSEVHEAAPDSWSPPEFVDQERLRAELAKDVPQTDGQ